MSAAVGTLAQLLRYPVKSLLGETLSSCEVERRGVAGDRLWAVVDDDGKLGSGKSSRRFRKLEGLLGLAASLPSGAEAPEITWSDGRRRPVGDPGLDEDLSALAGRRVRVQREGEVDHHDDGPVHLVTTASLRWLAEALGHEAPVARFRPNLVVDTPGPHGTPEQDWIGREVQVGAVVLRVVQPMPRCVMTTMAQADLDADPAVLRTLTDRADADFGVLLEVVTPGTVAVGDEVALR
jgi:uncharacterized protein YcbX